MEKNYQSLDDLLNDCTVRVNVGGGHGTGFFVAPGLILTCAHVIIDAIGRNVPVSAYCKYNGETIPVKQIGAEDVFSPPFPDLALLHVDTHNHPCVLLGTSFRASIDFYSYGYTKDHPEGESTTGEFEGTVEYGGTLIKLKDGQIKPGASGSPLLNRRTGSVCGMISNTRDRNSDLGGAGAPMEIIFAKFPDLERKNRTFHNRDHRWADLQEGTGKAETPRTVAALLYNESGKIPKPKQFVGRGRILGEVDSLLDQSKRVVLTGMGGIGKTSIAQMVVEKHLAENKMGVIWIEVKDEQADVVIEAIADRLGDEKISKLHQVEAQIQEMKEFLDTSEIGLLVLDNVQVSEISSDSKEIPINQILKAVPERLSVLITSRQRLSIGEIIEVDLLAPKDALKLLEQTSRNREVSSNLDAAKLCEQLGYHPYALELAGAMMRELNRTPRELRRRLKDAPLNLSSPTRGKLRALLDDSVAGLDTDARSVLYAFGAFLSTGATSTLVAAFLTQSVEEVFESLDKLESHNLIYRQPETDFYYLHDLTYYYVRSMAEPENEEDIQELVDAVISYLTENRKDYDLVSLDLPNILAIAQVARGLGLVKIMSYLTIGNYPLQEGKSYADQRGYSIGLMEQLDRAIESSKSLDSELKTTTHYLLGKRGNAAFRRGEYEFAADTFAQALSLAPSGGRAVMLGSALARTLAFCGRLEDSQNEFEKAGKLADKLDDDWLRGFVLEQQSHAAGHLKDYATALRVAEKQLSLAETLFHATNLEEYEPLAIALVNFGSAKLELAKLGHGDVKGVLDAYDRMKFLSEEHGDNRLRAHAHRSLGEYFHYTGDRIQAQLNFNQALEIWHRLEMIQEEQNLIFLMKELSYSVSNLLEDRNEHKA